MDKKTAKDRTEHLRAAIDKYRYAYHVEDKSLIGDEALDSLKKELFDLEQQFPDLVTPDSPTQRVAGKPLAEFKKARHESPMLSLTDAFSEDDVRAWFTRLNDFLGREVKPEFYCEPKIDGLAIELVYENGLFVQGSTRGDGTVGEDVTQNLKTIEAIPLRLAKKAPKRLVVRGEVFLTKKDFARINRELEKGGKKTFANPRNLAAGTIRQLDSAITASRKMDSFAYAVVTDFGQKTHAEEHELLHALGFKTNPDTKLVHSLDEVLKYRDDIEKKREKLSYEIDGVVIIVNDNRTFAEASAAGKGPRAATAYKFSPKEATTIVREINVQVGRTGVLTPVATLDPVEVGGVTISHATLHNADEIERLGLKIGDTVIVSRAGDVIPKIIKVLPELRTRKEKAFHFPTKCPFDGSPVVSDGVLRRCSNKNCGARQRESIYHFVSRGAFNIEGLGPKIIDRFIKEGLVAQACDLFSLTKGDIEILERFGEKSAENIVQEIHEKKRITLPRFLYALGIVHVGEETANALSGAISNFSAEGGSASGGQFPISKPKGVWQALSKMTIDDLQKIPDVGPKVAQSIYDWFHNPASERFMKELDTAGIEIESHKSLVIGHKLDGKIFVLTGTLSSMSRDEAKEKIRALGGEVSESVSKKTSYVVVGSEPGSKAEKAVKLGVKTLSEKEFLELLTK